MSIEANKTIVRRFFEEAPDGEFDTLADDARFTISGKLGFCGVYSKEQMRAFHKKITSVQDGPLEIKVTRMIGEGNLVAAEATGSMRVAGGKYYNNNYFIMFEVDGNSITNVVEYNDTHHVKDVFAL